MNNLLCTLLLVGTAMVTIITPPAYATPIMGSTNIQTSNLLQEVSKEVEDSESVFGPDIDHLTPIFNDIASMIISRLARDPDPTTLDTARKYIDKAKAFIEPVAKFISPSNKESNDAIHLIGKFFSSLKEMTGSDDIVINQNTQLATDILYNVMLKALETA